MSGGFAARLGFLGVYLALLAGLKWFDVWGEHFSQGGAHYALYNLARLLFVPYLGIVLIATGNLVAGLIARRRTGEETPGPGPLDAFYLGAATWVLGGFLLGIAHAIYWAPLAALTAWLVWRGHPTAARLWQRALSGVSKLGRMPLSSLAWAGALIASLGTVIVLVALNVGFAVFDFEYDASGHYLPYYAQVVAGHSTVPNEYWYHFWVSKGAFLHFLSVVLTDIQGPQLVSFLMLLAASAAAHGVIRDATGDWRWGLVGATVLVAPFIAEFHFFQKHHVVTLSLAAGLLWLGRPVLSDAPRAGTWQAAAMALLGAALVCNTPPIAAVVLPFFLCYGIWLCGRRAVAPPKAFLPLAAGTLVIAGVLGMNYAWTGLAEVTPFKIFLAFANQEKLANYVSPYLLIFAQEGSSDTTGRLSLEAFSSLKLLWERLGGLLRTRALMPPLAAFLPVLVTAMAVTAGFSRRFRQACARHLGPALLLIGVGVAFGFLVNQPGSLERFYTFAAYPLVIVTIGSIGLLWWTVNARFSRMIMQSIAAALTIALAAGSAYYWISHYLRLNGTEYVKEKAAFLAGRRSFEQALTYVHRRSTERGWPRRDLSQECLAIRDFLTERGARGGAEPPKVWTITFLQESGCHVLPGIQLQMEFSVRFGPRWHRIVFGTPEEALVELAQLGISRFYVNLGDFDITRPEAISTSLFGCMAYSPLFQPDSLKSRFRIAWRNGDAVLLELARGGEPASSEITDAFIDAWRRKAAPIQHGLGAQGTICGRVADYYRAQGERWPVVRDPALPPIKGWQ